MAAQRKAVAAEARTDLACPIDAKGQELRAFVSLSPYMVGPYVEGDYVVFVPWTDLKPYLSVQGTALFGGTRAPSDKDQQP